MAKIKFGLDPKLSFKKAFFDRAKVNKQLGKAVSKILRQAGGFTRTVARRSMKKKSKKGGDGLYGQKISQPGSPPLFQTRLLKDNIFYYADLRWKRVIIGPTKAGGGGAEALEYGGTHTAWTYTKVEMRVDKKDGKRKLMPALELETASVKNRWRKKSVMYKARPYMRPALRIMLDVKMKDWLKDPMIPRSLKNTLKQQRI